MAFGDLVTLEVMMLAVAGLVIRVDTWTPFPLTDEEKLTPEATDAGTLARVKPLGELVRTVAT